MKVEFFCWNAPSKKMEKEINEFLKANPNIKILSILQSISPASYYQSHFVITIWYKEGK